jgi:hypothetical protein
MKHWTDKDTKYTPIACDSLDVVQYVNCTKMTPNIEQLKLGEQIRNLSYLNVANLCAKIL